MFRSSSDPTAPSIALPPGAGGAPVDPLVLQHQRVQVIAAEHNFPVSVTLSMIDSRESSGFTRNRGRKKTHNLCRTGFSTLSPRPMAGSDRTQELSWHPSFINLQFPHLLC